MASFKLAINSKSTNSILNCNLIFWNCSEPIEAGTILQRRQQVVCLAVSKLQCWLFDGVSQFALCTTPQIWSMTRECSVQAVHHWSLFPRKKCLIWTHLELRADKIPIVWLFKPRFVWAFQLGFCLFTSVPNSLDQVLSPINIDVLFLYELLAQTKIDQLSGKFWTPKVCASKSGNQFGRLSRLKSKHRHL